MNEDSENSKGVQLCKRWEAFEATLGSWRSFWESLAYYVQPRKSEITTKQATGPNTDTTAYLFDNTAVQANMTLAQGQMSLVSPTDEVWFEFLPPEPLRDDEAAVGFYRNMSDIVRKQLAKSNFYSQIHEVYLQRGGFGTSVLYSDWYRGALFFKCHDIGTYAIAEDSRGVVDTFAREYPLTARQAIQEFGEENVSPEIRQKASEFKTCDEPFQFIHFCMPRVDIDRTKPASQRMPFASYHVDVKTKTIVKESGFEEFPFHVSRYLNWSDTVTEPYGWCPAWTALPDIRQINLLQQYLDTLAETAAFPRVIAPATMEGEVDLRALGITYFDPITDRHKPEEWATQGRYDIGLDRVEQRRKAINEAFHVDLFKMFSHLEKQAQMSVREVVERSSEKLLQFSPTFSRLVYELFNPMLLRVTNLCARNGLFNDLEIPSSLANASNGGFEISDPEIQYQSRIALALQSLQNAAAIQTMEAVMPIAQIDPSILDTFDFDAMVRGFARNTGLPEKWMRSVAEADQRRREREELMIAQQEAQIAKDAAQAQPRP